MVLFTTLVLSFFWEYVSVIKVQAHAVHCGMNKTLTYSLVLFVICNLYLYLAILLFCL